MTNPTPPTPFDEGAPGRWLVGVALATAVVLGLVLPEQLFDTNFYTLWEATGLLAGEHPYRDFFEWGVPLQAALSAAVQWIVGNRMVGEFVLIHWAFIIGGAVISFDLGYRLTRSIPATAFMAAIGLAMIPDTPTFHYPKLFFYPLAVWIAWRYLDRPRVLPAAALGLVTALAFLFRHDHGVYIGVAAVLACVLARVTAPGRPWRDTIRRQPRLHGGSLRAARALAARGAGERGGRGLRAGQSRAVPHVVRPRRLSRAAVGQPDEPD